MAKKASKTGKVPAHAELQKENAQLKKTNAELKEKVKKARALSAQNGNLKKWLEESKDNADTLLDQANRLSDRIVVLTTDLQKARQAKSSITSNVHSYAAQGWFKRAFTSAESIIDYILN